MRECSSSSSITTQIPWSNRCGTCRRVREHLKRRDVVVKEKRLTVYFREAVDVGGADKPAYSFEGSLPCLEDNTLYMLSISFR